MERKSSRSSTRTPSEGNSTRLAEAQIAATRRRLREAKPRDVREGEAVAECATCRGDLVATASLERHFVHPGREIVVTGLSGEKCLGCGEEWLDAPSIARLSPYQEGRIVASYEGRITIVGGGNLGTYIPKDLATSVGLSKGTLTRMFILDENHILIRVER